jgi:uncharacterized repeat protein (TIGR01451 family)
VKSADRSAAGPGDLVTYTLKATNHGPDTANGVKITDPLPPEVEFVSASPPCALGGSVVTCAYGSLASGASATATVTVRVKADLSTATQSDHLIGVQKVEQFVGLAPGETRSAGLACPDGYVMTDASARFDDVDQGAGDPTDFEVREARSDSTGSYSFVLRNNAAGEMQAHLFGVCVSRETTGGAHAHELVLTGPVAKTITLGPGSGSATLTCPSGTQPISPSFRVTSGSARPLTSEPGPTPSSWVLGYAADAAATVEASVRCMDRTLTAAAGHTETLDLSHVERQVTIPAGATVDETVSCPDQAKGIVATYDGDVVQLGSTPVPKSRIFRLHNPASQAVTVTIDLVCLGDRPSSKPGTVDVVNTGRVSSTGPVDPNPSNDSSSHTLEVK